ncbi:hypothetical protein EDB39_12730, partial [Vibrio crassostreae]
MSAHVQYSNVSLFTSEEKGILDQAASILKSKLFIS